MNNTIQSGHELLCKNCGCVLGVAEEHHDQPSQKSLSLDLLILGGAFQGNGKLKSPQQCYEENTTKFLTSFMKKYDLPEVIAIDVFNVMKKKRRGFQSENNKIAIKTIIQILSKDDYYPYWKKLKMIKSDYEKSFNG